MPWTFVISGTTTMEEDGISSWNWNPRSPVHVPWDKQKQTLEDSHLCWAATPMETANVDTPEAPGTASYLLRLCTYRDGLGEQGWVWSSVFRIFGSRRPFSIKTKEFCSTDGQGLPRCAAMTARVGWCSQMTTSSMISIWDSILRDSLWGHIHGAPIHTRDPHMSPQCPTSTTTFFPTSTVASGRGNVSSSIGDDRALAVRPTNPQSSVRFEAEYR